jgi:hypothetical protein
MAPKRPPVVDTLRHTSNTVNAITLTPNVLQCDLLKRHPNIPRSSNWHEQDDSNSDDVPGILANVILLKAKLHLVKLINSKHPTNVTESLSQFSATQQVQLLRCTPVIAYD